MNNSQGLVIIISSPSGAGKSTLVKNLMSFDPNLRLSVSYTTREPRRGEIEGRDYHFISKAEFEAKITSNLLLEHAEIFGNSYGTSKDEVEALLNSGRDVIFDIDWHGQQQIFKQFPPEQLCSVFVLPPSLKALKQRLEARAADTAQAINVRFNNATSEINYWRDYHYTIVNDNIDNTVADLQAIIRCKRLERFTNHHAPEFVNKLIQEAK